VNSTDLRIRLEKLENIGARVAVMIERDVEELKERVRVLERESVDKKEDI
jgi:hypothetical protein